MSLSAGVGWADEIAPFISTPADEKPAFEVRMPDGHIYKVFANGHTEGFAEDRKYIICNRIDALIREAYCKGLLTPVPEPKSN